MLAGILLDVSSAHVEVDSPGWSRSVGELGSVGLYNREEGIGLPARAVGGMW